MQQKGPKIQLVMFCDRPLPTKNRSELSKAQSLCRDGAYKPTVVALQDYLILCVVTAEMIQFSQESLE